MWSGFQRRFAGSAAVEIGVTYLLTLLAVRALVQAVGVGVPEAVLAGVPLLFIFAPEWACRFRGVDAAQYPIWLVPFGDTSTWIRALRWGGGLSIAVSIPFIVGYHLWHTVGVPWVEAASGFRLVAVHAEFQGHWPSNMVLLVLIHLVGVALPEEIFYRGYMQTRLDEVWPTRWTWFGAEVGPGLLVTSFLFAIGHSLVLVQWWHIFIFFPSLAFGWLRARTGGILAGVFFHAWCNVAVTTLDTLYGMVSP